MLTPDDGLPGAVNLDNVQTIPNTNLGAFVTHLSPERMRDVRRDIAFALGFDGMV